jgi:hypothetical protein
MKLFVSLVVLLTVLSCNAFRLTQQKRYSVTAQRAAITPSSRSSSNPISDFFDSMFKVFPEVLSSTKPVNYDNVIRDLPAFSKAGGHQMTLSKWRKYYKSESGFKRQDIIDDFNAKYVPSKRQIKDLKVTKLYQLLLDLDEQELISELNAIISNMDEYEGDFIANAVSTAFARLDSPMDPSRVNDNPMKFNRSVKLSDLKKTLRNDPCYFN